MDDSGCFIIELVTEYLQLWCEDSLKLQTQDALAIFQSRRRPLLVSVEALQGFLSSFFGLKLVNHLTCQKISAFVTPAKRLHTITNTKNMYFRFDTQPYHSCSSKKLRVAIFTPSRRRNKSLARVSDARFVRMAVVMTSQR